MVDILVVSGEVDVPFLRRHPYESRLASKLIAEVGFLIEESVVEKSLLSAVEGCCGKCEDVGWTMIMGYLHVRLHTSS